MADTTQPPVAAAPTIHEASRASGPSGAVEWGRELSFNEAVAQRERGMDIVVRGSDEIATRAIAKAIEAAVGPTTRPQFPHVRSAGPAALPHFHQFSGSPDGHSFYETNRRKARRRK